MSVGHEEVEQSVVIEVEKACAPAEKRNRKCGDSSAKADVSEGRVPFIPVQRVVVVGEIRDVKTNFTVAIVIAHRDSHGGFLTTIVVQSASLQVPTIIRSALLLVRLQELRTSSLT